MFSCSQLVYTYLSHSAVLEANKSELLIFAEKDVYNSSWIYFQWCRILHEIRKSNPISVHTANNLLNEAALTIYFTENSKQKIRVNINWESRSKHSIRGFDLLSTMHFNQVRASCCNHRFASWITHNQLFSFKFYPASSWMLGEGVNGYHAPALQNVIRQLDIKLM